MKHASTISELRPFLHDWQKQGKTVALIPTMGALHEGHLSLVTLAKEHADITVVTIFVNPTQFAPHEDLATYPRTLARDLELLEQNQVDLVFYPQAQDIYPSDFQTTITNSRLSTGLCGASRPNFFAGVCTVCCKLFNLVRPDFAVFGKKDFQQFKVIEQMTKDLHLPITIIPANIYRESDGLATSSRNRYLSPSERIEAPKVYLTLQRVKHRFHENERDSNKLMAFAREELGQIPDFTLDYCEIRTTKDLTLVTGVIDQESLILVAGYLGKTRLLDNLELHCG